MRRLLLILMSTVAPLLAGCDMLGIESGATVAARREAEGRAIGAGCRHAARSIEQCYAMNKRAEKAAVFAGWRDMNDYMRENKLEAMPALPEPESAVAANTAAAAEGAESAQAGPAATAEKAATAREPARH